MQSPLVSVSVLSPSFNFYLKPKENLCLSVTLINVGSACHRAKVRQLLYCITQQGTGKYCTEKLIHDAAGNQWSDNFTADIQVWKANNYLSNRCKNTVVEQIFQILGRHVPGNSLVDCDTNSCAAAAAIRPSRSSNGGDCWEKTSSGFSFWSCRSATPEGFWGFAVTLSSETDSKGCETANASKSAGWIIKDFKSRLLANHVTYWVLLLLIRCYNCTAKKCVSPTEPLHLHQ